MRLSHIQHHVLCDVSYHSVEAHIDHVYFWNLYVG